MGRGIIYCKDGHPLLLKWFKSFLETIRYMRGASEELIVTYGSQHAISAEADSQIAHKMPDLGYVPSQHRK